jgi:hypothetical protein
MRAVSSGDWFLETLPQKVPNWSVFIVEMARHVTPSRFENAGAIAFSL